MTSRLMRFGDVARPRIPDRQEAGCALDGPVSTVGTSSSNWSLPSTGRRAAGYTKLYLVENVNRRGTCG
jgi:hypothetical protein